MKRRSKGERECRSRANNADLNRTAFSSFDAAFLVLSGQEMKERTTHACGDSQKLDAISRRAQISAELFNLVSYFADNFV